MLTHPLVALALVIALALLAGWILPRLFRFIARVLRRMFGSRPSGAGP